MALPGSLPLLLLPLLLASAVAYEFQQLNDVAAILYVTETKAAESECTNSCGSWEGCSGFKYDAATSACQIFQTDCRGPGVNAPLTPDYNAKNSCPDSACGCPAGFQRYGTRCYGIPDQTARDWEDGFSRCHGMNAQLAAPLTQQEQDQVALAAVQLQTAPALQMVWIDAIFEEATNDWRWFYHRACGPVSKFFWATGEPDAGLHYVAYAPSGMAQAEGWYAQNWDAQHLSLCQLNECYRPDCPQ